MVFFWMIDVTLRHITHKYIDENYEGGPYPKFVSESKKRNEKRKQKRTSNLKKKGGGKGAGV